MKKTTTKKPKSYKETFLAATIRELELVNAYYKAQERLDREDASQVDILREMLRYALNEGAKL